MATLHHSSTDTRRSEVVVRRMLREIGYVLYLSRKLANEIKSEKNQLVRPEMSDFCAVDSATFAL